jgi:hypothetical protein
MWGSQTERVRAAAVDGRGPHALTTLTTGWLAVTRTHEHHTDHTEKGDPAAAVTAATPAATQATTTS